MKIAIKYILKGFIVLAGIIFLLTWVFGVGYVPISILFLSGLLIFIALACFIKSVPWSTMSYTLISYLGISFLTLSKFKTEIAAWNTDINMIGVGLALIAIAIAIGLPAQRKEQKSEAEYSVGNSTPEVSNETKETMTDQELPSIDIILDEARRALDFQFKQLDGLDTKSGIMLGIAGVVITLLVSTLIGMPDLNSSFLVKIVGAIMECTPMIGQKGLGESGGMLHYSVE